MPTDEHYFIEQTDDKRLAVRAKGSEREQRRFDTQDEAIAAKKLNPNDHPDVERVRNTESGGRDQWRSKG
jgi:hypothetical protein